ncbi:hypothetical protein [Chitinophaga niabensis]|uniref:DUF4919 domain-containing protein n=1 Tax=Chitinophaga niabensis TaxID=536979 RepID=A0A1N6GZI6_9BACT|nr:hypothetical protein [Chitinophaga niabensis]SIO12906.1 hypothetical protein SAMN04488055_3081 [Chitinophaga niabensis]
MKFNLLIAVLFCSLQVFAQEGPSEESLAYHEYRSKMSVPPYELAKIKKLVAGLKTVYEESDEGHQTMPEKIYNALSLREKFTYNMIHAEDFSQNCDIFFALDEHKKIFGHLLDIFGDSNWSERQYKFFKENRDSVMALIKESVLRSKRMGVNYKYAIVEMNGWEMVPFLISTYNTDRKDHDILTVLMLLMEQNKYPVFVASASYAKLYGKDAAYDGYLDLNKANEDLIMQRADNFYKSKK